MFCLIYSPRHIACESPLPHGGTTARAASTPSCPLPSDPFSSFSTAAGVSSAASPCACVSTSASAAALPGNDRPTKEGEELARRTWGDTSGEEMRISGDELKKRTSRRSQLGRMSGEELPRLSLRDTADGKAGEAGAEAEPLGSGYSWAAKDPLCKALPGDLDDGADDDEHADEIIGGAVLRRPSGDTIDLGKRDPAGEILPEESLGEVGLRRSRAKSRRLSSGEAGLASAESPCRTWTSSMSFRLRELRVKRFGSTPCEMRTNSTHASMRVPSRLRRWRTR